MATKNVGKVSYKKLKSPEEIQDFSYWGSYPGDFLRYSPAGKKKEGRLILFEPALRLTVLFLIPVCFSIPALNSSHSYLQSACYISIQLLFSYYIFISARRWARRHFF